MKYILSVLQIVFFSFMIATTVSAHSGRTDSSGCHTCRTNCASWGLSTGEYHCHRAKSTAPQPKEPIRSHKVEGGTGYTTPAPDYKTPINLEDDTKPNSNNILNKSDNQKPTENGSGKDSRVLVWTLLAGGAGYLIYRVKKR